MPIAGLALFPAGKYQSGRQIQKHSADAHFSEKPA